MASIRLHDGVRVTILATEPPFAGAPGFVGTVVKVLDGGAAFVVELDAQSDPPWAPLLRHLDELDRQPPKIVGRWTRDDLYERRMGLSRGAWAAGGGGRGFVSAAGAGGGA
jgi:hypothetical protein